VSLPVCPPALSGFHRFSADEESSSSSCVTHRAGAQ
jgi:hypothetical protein